MGAAINARDLGPALHRPRRRRFNHLPYALITPASLAIFGILAFPLGMLVWISLQHYGLRELIAHQGQWVGLDNYKTILSDPLFHQVVIRTLLFTLACVALTIVLSTLISLLLLRVRQAIRVLVEYEVDGHPVRGFPADAAMHGYTVEELIEAELHEAIDVDLDERPRARGRNRPRPLSPPLCASLRLGQRP